ncbi:MULTISPECIES: MarR family winged helix-turn-helix transcriptional regulator [Actinomadura]|uniref:MarR family winged helix-turn-helix transcriptional regulator n=1 Tax=Actinomadura yumaensis TaxID=111807 RepID=A0ABW2CXZ2_9ACTN|nr:MarR family transcriptional regulator [Actinomadura sp. J1-007]MWK39238.1 MarR family transcriptional regulator [Actinomadura sp. J1-007]
MASPQFPAEVPREIMEIERAITRISHLLTRSRRHDRTVAAAGVPVDRAAVPMLRLLAEQGEPMRPSEMAARLAVEAPHVTRQVQRLERAGYVERVPDPDDGRAQRVRLCDSGRDAVECIRAVGRRWMDEALAGWSPDERRLLAGLVHRMVDDFVAHADSLSDQCGLPADPHYERQP